MSAYLNGVSEAVFKVGLCLPIGTCVSDDDVRYIVECIKEAIGITARRNGGIRGSRIFA